MAAFSVSVVGEGETRDKEGEYEGRGSEGGEENNRDLCRSLNLKDDLLSNTMRYSKEDAKEEEKINQHEHVRTGAPIRKSVPSGALSCISAQYQRTSFSCASVSRSGQRAWGR